jgi:hypothetical protein
MTKDRKDYAAEFARKGGKARAKSLTPGRRKEIARNAAASRWAQKVGSKSGKKKGGDHGR